MSKTRLIQQGRRITSSVQMDVCQQARLPERPVHRALPPRPCLFCFNGQVQPRRAACSRERCLRNSPASACGSSKLLIAELKMDDCILLRNLTKVATDSLSVCLSVSQSVCLSVCLSVCQSVQFSSVQFSSVLFSSVLFSSVQFCSVQFCSVLFSSVLFCSVLFSSVQFWSVLVSLTV